MLDIEESPEEFPLASEDIPASGDTPATASENAPASEGTSAPPQAPASVNMSTADYSSQLAAPTEDVLSALQDTIPEAAAQLIAPTLATAAAAPLQQTFYAAMPRPLAPVVGSTPTAVQGVAPVGPRPIFPIKGTPVRFLQSRPSVLEREVRLAQPAAGPVLVAVPDSAPSAAVCTSETLKGRAAIAQQVERSMLGHFSGMTNATLTQWRSQLDNTLADATTAHSDAKDAIKKVDLARGTARDAYRAEQHNPGLQVEWKTQVSNFKTTSENLKEVREAYYRAAAAHDMVLREIKRRAGDEAEVKSESATAGDGAKRRRQTAPEELCPYCDHIYTVRDGFSTKTNSAGERLHLRKCQCREKTPPCRNCPQCKEMAEITTLADPNQQMAACQDRFQCEICACRCPGAGKWVESDPTSRAAYADRTVQRRQALQSLGWDGAMSEASAPANIPVAVASAMVVGPSVPIKRERRANVRLPQDIRSQLGVRATPPSVAAQSGMSTDNTTDALLTLAAQPVLPSPLPTPAFPPLPRDVLLLVEEVFTMAAGQGATARMADYLQSQRVMVLADLEFMELSWLQNAFPGMPLMLLNKFLSLASRRAGL